MSAAIRAKISDQNSADKRLPTYGFLAGAVLVVGRLLPMPLGDHSILHVPDICPFRNMTGLPCPFCGMTRSVVCAMHGDIAGSLKYHPLGIAFCIVMAVVFAATLLSVIAPKTAESLVSHLNSTILWRIALASFLIAWVVRLAGVDPLPG